MVVLPEPLSPATPKMNTLPLSLILSISDVMVYLLLKKTLSFCSRIDHT
jgi:hypothetical protein